MAHFAKIGKGNIVEKIDVISNDVATTEQEGVNFLQDFYKTSAIWKQTSYNTVGGEHKLGGTPLRKNFASVNFKYDQIRDAFIPPKPFNSWTLNEDTCLWEAPVAYPTDNQKYRWNETTQQWDLINE